MFGPATTRTRCRTSPRGGARHRSSRRSYSHLGPGPPALEPFQPRRGLEPREELLRFRQKRRGVRSSSLREEPLAVLQQSAPEPERDAELAKRARCALVVRLGNGRLTVLLGHV